MNKIVEAREKYGNPECDNELGLTDKKHFYILSVKFFKFFYDTYDCNQLIQVKYYTVQEEREVNPDTLTQSSIYDLPSNSIKSFEYTAIYEGLNDILRNSAVQEIKEEAMRIKNMKTTLRKAEEQKLFKEYKNDYSMNNEYLVSSKFINQWLYLMESE